MPWLGYLFGWSLAKVFKRPPKDCLAIALETGIQNTGISIFLLRFSLPQPEADLTTGEFLSNDPIDLLSSVDDAKEATHIFV